VRARHDRINQYQKTERHSAWSVHFTHRKGENAMHLISQPSDQDGPAAPFTIAYADWMRARAEIAACEAAPDGEIRQDERVAEAVAAIAAAEWKLVQTPAKSFLDVQARATVVRQMFDEADWEGVPTDNRHRVMLDVLVSEILVRV
jgi:hypothetical protein